MNQIRLGFIGGPLDGSGVTIDADEIEPEHVLQILVQGTFLYESNGPIDGIESDIGLSYKGRKRPSWNDGGVCVIEHQ